MLPAPTRNPAAWRVSPAQQLQASLFILAPLLSAVITALVPKPA
jgi:hypothetical protein